VIARLASSGKRPPGVAELVKGLRRFSPRELTDAQWREVITGVLGGLQAREIVDDQRRVAPEELARRIGRHAARAWKQLADRVLPALALGVEPGDSKAHGRLTGRDEWATAIAARVLGMWTDGPPPSPSGLCDALVWRDLELEGAPKRCPPEVRAHFVRRHAGGDAGPPERLVRGLAAQTVDAPRVELQALRDGLVRLWLAGRTVGTRDAVPQPPPAATRGPASPASTAAPSPASTAAHSPTSAAAPSPASTAAPSPASMAVPATATVPTPARSLIADVRAVADAAREGVFGDRKVFISAVWEALRAMPEWAGLELDDLKARLVAAHRNRELVLERADFVAAMDPALVDASETGTDGATFHFVLREPAR
jgi:hypothetical protein